MDLREFIDRINNGEDPKEIDMEERRKKVMDGKTKEEYLQDLEKLRGNEVKVPQMKNGKCLKCNRKVVYSNNEYEPSLKHATCPKCGTSWTIEK